MAANKKRRKPHLLSHTRPTSTNRKPSLSSQATRSLIRKHHTLQKRLHAALSNGDTAAADGIRAQLAASGGLQKYQEASIQGQSAERGGDTSKVLVEWLNELSPSTEIRNGSTDMRRLRMLEVGALKVDNACSRSGIFDVTRIDLHSQHPGIQTQDFMEMPLPSKGTLETDGFDIISLSLVINYVGDAVGRGEMLKRVGSFLKVGPRWNFGSTSTSDSVYPALFLVLPGPCITNSRYFDEERLERIMTALGYAKLRSKLSKKLVYYLWRYVGVEAGRAKNDVLFKKQEIRPGSQRNNFKIILQ
ncbi:MAG: hypothetical protein LQ338_006939 [Usnochroma carphineum]|nr:MAG: hypothetical protein LQ338_006939 [Usnochroma carphineum]